MNSSTRSAAQTLIDLAIGKANHIYASSCPDQFDGHEIRDADCPVCQAIDAMRAALDGTPVDEPVARVGIGIGPTALGQRTTFVTLTGAGRALPSGTYDLFTRCSMAKPPAHSAELEAAPVVQSAA